MEVARLLYVAGEDINHPNLKFKDDDDIMTLFDCCHDIIRMRLLEVNQHKNLFIAIERLGLASPASKLLVFNISLSNNEEEPEEEKPEEEERTTVRGRNGRGKTGRGRTRRGRGKLRQS